MSCRIKGSIPVIQTGSCRQPQVRRAVLAVQNYGVAEKKKSYINLKGDIFCRSSASSRFVIMTSYCDCNESQ